MAELAITGGLPPWLRPQARQFIQALNGQRLAHAWLVEGPSGTGQSLLVEYLCRLLLCAQPGREEGSDLPSACGQCRDCKFSATGNHPDLLRISPEENSDMLTVDNIRRIPDFAHLSRHQAQYRIVMLHPANRMTTSASNALLKTLEEPPEHCIVLLASEQSGGLLATIRSRCQRLATQLPDTETAAVWLQEQGVSNASKLLQLAGGAPLTALEWSQSELAPDFDAWETELVAIAAGGQAPETLADQITTGVQARHFLAWIEQYCRKTLSEKLAGQPPTTSLGGLDPNGLIALANQIQALLALSGRPLRWERQVAGLLYALQHGNRLADSHRARHGQNKERR